MSLIADGLLIATCLTTALYCLVLSRRLKRLSSTDEGVGQQILRLNTALQETKATVSEIRSTAAAASSDLERDIEAAKRQSNQLQMQIARAIKSGVGPIAAVPAEKVEQSQTEEDAGPVRPLRTREPDEPVPAPVVDFEAADDLMDDLAEDERHDETDPAERPASKVEVEPDVDDIAAGANHWPFEERPAEPTDVDPEDAEEITSAEELADVVPTEPRRPAARRRGAAAEDGDASLLRVERMTV